MKDEQTLLEYAEQERHNNPWWDDVHRIINDVLVKAANAPMSTSDFKPLKGEYCHNCGLPSDVCVTRGVKVVLRLKTENAFKREHKKTVWCHDTECAIQALAIAKYGSASHKWPITLAQFRAMTPLSDVTKITPEGVDSKEPKIAVLGNMDVPHSDPIFVTKRGRPRKVHALTPAERVRAYRQRALLKAAA